ncbi:hypothetical protein CRYUN_Cryun10bG0155000 [Craigia yunnanensis]
MRVVRVAVEAEVKVAVGVQEAIGGLYQNRGHLHLPDYPDQGQSPTDCRNVVGTVGNIYCKFLPTFSIRNLEAFMNVLVHMVV